MKLPTDLMLQILKNTTAQRIIDFVSPIYGDSYVGLWIYEAIGEVLGEIYDLAEILRYETNPITTTVLMDYWEDHYDLYRDSSLTMEQRRARLLDKIRSRAPCNPKRLAASVSTVLGVPVEITERVAKNTFQVEVLDSVSDFRKLLQAVAVLNKRKPAHLIYWWRVTSRVDETDLKLATAQSQQEEYKVGVEAIKLQLQTTLERAIKLGATVSIGEQYRIDPESITMETRTDIEHRVLAAAPVSSAEQYSVAEIKRAARIAVETAFKIASPVFSNEEYTIEEVKTNE